MDDTEVASDGEITKGRKRRELLRRMKKAGQKPDRGEEHALRKVILLAHVLWDMSVHTTQLGNGARPAQGELTGPALRMLGRECSQNAAAA